MTKKRPDLRLIAALAALLTVTTACAGGAPLRVGLKQHAAELVFGIPALGAALPANIAPPQGEFIAGARTGADASRQIKPGLGRKPCPDAEFNTVNKEAGPTVEAGPAAGRYRWKAGGDFAITGFSRRFPIPPFEVREITEVKTLEKKGDFTFATVQREAWTGDAISSVFQVIFDHPETEDGIYLTRVLRTRGAGSSARTAVFEPKPPILYIGLPVTVAPEVAADYTGVYASTQFSSTGVDPDSLESMTLTGRVTERRRYDACGQMVDSFFVDAELTFTSGSAEPSPTNPTGSTTRSVKYNYAIATQFGGIIVFEQIESPCPSYNQQTQHCEPEPQVKYQANIGQVTPDV